MTLAEPEADTSVNTLFVLGVSAAGGAAYVVGALEAARERGARTASLSSNPATPIERAADLPIVVDTDAHDPSAVGRMDLAAAFLESVRMDPELILNLRGNLEKLMAFLRVDNEMPYDAK